MSNASLKIVKTEKAEQAESKQVGNISEILQQQIEEITRKKRLADNRKIFLNKRTSLQEYKAQIQEEKQSGSFDSTKLKISLSGVSSYREEDKISLQNVDLILEFIDMLTLKIDEMVSKIEAEIIA